MSPDLPREPCSSSFHNMEGFFMTVDKAGTMQESRFHRLRLLKAGACSLLIRKGLIRRVWNGQESSRPCPAQWSPH